MHDARPLNILLSLVHELRELGDRDAVQLRVSWPPVQIRLATARVCLPYVRRPRLRSLTRIRQAIIQPVLPVHPHGLGFLLRLCGPELVAAMLLDDLLNYFHSLGERTRCRTLQFEE